MLNMHGLKAADILLSKVEAEVAKNPGREVVEVRVKVGRYLFADARELTSAWELIVRDTPLSKARLVLETTDGRDVTLAGLTWVN